MLAAAKRPTLYVGVGLRRHGLTELVVRLAEHLRLPLATDVLGKAAIPESHPQFAGVYMGVLGAPDCVIVIGVVRTDLGTGFWTECINPKSRIGIAGSSRWSCAPRSSWSPVITPRWASPGRSRWERESSSPRGGRSRLWAMVPFR